ncbi:inositol-1-monophosphatase [Paramagnetospirillum marisnigri]|uniref:Inositol-1-monophosphatase n=1 Tax=Paramagnetospirillum marisnigri TaxID=1285242 RepID=A0A178M7Q3_9PROT|nr:inositol monophosphatase [Paramagnetospirillum marisnigri]OAN43924.1 inositol-1-monophosphatase [Paramagnetospirillum marisnigri]
MVDPQSVAAIIREVAEAEILPRFGHLSAGQIREKKPGQLVTEADTEAERVLSLRLTGLLPGSKVVGEEGVDADPALLGALEQSDPVWIIDPVDGTGNFAKANPRFAVIIALVVDKITRAGWIYDPVAGRMVVAEQGSGAWLGGDRLSVLAPAPLEKMTGSVKRSAHLVSKVAKVGRKGSAAHDYIDLVTGVLHFAHFARLMPWDHAAGVLIHAEAGGYSSLLNHKPYQPIPCKAGLLLAPSEGSWRSLKVLVE